MAGVVTLLDEIDETDLVSRVHLIRRTFRYVRAIEDNEAIIITPTVGDAVNLKKGYIEAPWASVISMSVSNLSVEAITPALPPFLAMSLNRGPADITTNINEGQAVDVLGGEDRAWPASFPVNNPETVRTFPVSSQASGGRTYFMGFSSKADTAATWELTLQCKVPG